MLERRPIPGYEGLYEATIDGNVYRIDIGPQIGGKFRKQYEKEQRAISSRIRKGYRVVRLCKLGKITQLSVHRIIAELFIPNPHNYNIVNHINGNKTDNRINNLEWCNKKYNFTHYQENIQNKGIKRNVNGILNRGKTKTQIIDSEGNITEFSSISAAANHVYGYPEAASIIKTHWGKGTIAKGKYKINILY